MSCMSVWMHRARGGGGWQGLRSKQEECRYHSSNYCFINGPRVAVNELLHQSVLTARSLARHSRSCLQSVDFNLAQKLIIRFRRNLVSCWMCWRRRRGRCSRLPAQLKHTQPAITAQQKHTSPAHTAYSVTFGCGTSMWRWLTLKNRGFNASTCIHSLLKG